MKLEEFNTLCRTLSKTQLEALNKLKDAGTFIRWEGGFWSPSSSKVNGFVTAGWSGKQCPVPEWYCGVSTLRALERKWLVCLDETNRICKLNEIE